MKELSGTQFDSVLTRQNGGIAVLTLNRPDVLNALSYEMIRFCRDRLLAVENDEGCSMVCFKGAGDRSFCAGGDIKAIYYEGQDNLDKADLYFHEEYSFNRLIYNYKKPVLSYMDGIVMGGGYGIGGPSRYRIITERSVFAMPEVSIGLFPDVGSMYRLTRCPGRTGLYLALTGYHAGPADMLYCGLADYYIPAANWPLCEERLAALPAGKGEVICEAIGEILSSYHQDPEKSGHLEARRDEIDRIFSAGSIEEILAGLDAAGQEWARETASHIRSRCPKSVRITWEHYQKAIGKSFDEVTATDFNLVRHVLRDTEFYEGIRALLIDKDKTPHWTPDRLEDVTDAMLARFFSPAGKALDPDR